MDLLTVVGVAVIFPFLIYIAVMFGVPAIMGIREAMKPSVPVWGKILLVVQAVLWGGASLLFLIAPVAHNGDAGLVGMVVGAIIWGAFFRERPKDS